MSRIEEAILKVKAQAQAQSQAQAHEPHGPARGPAAPAPAEPPYGTPTGIGQTPATAPAAGGPTAATAAMTSASGTYRMPPVSDLLSTTAMYASVVAAPKKPARTIAIDLQALIGAGLLPPKDDARQVSNEFRAIKRTLIGNITGRSGTKVPGGNLIMVASALPGEGKTFCALNLALTLSLEKDYSVVLIDGDVAKPNISRELGLADAPGLLDVLRSGEGDLAGIEIGTSVPRLSIVPAGRPDDDAAELLSSSRMARLVEEIRSQPNRLFVFDSTPLLLTNESRVLAEVAGQVVLVVRAASTPRTAVKSAIAELPEDVYVGVVLNQKEASPGSDYYGYGDYGQTARETP
jgi:protein-tyrosine kinase